MFQRALDVVFASGKLWCAIVYIDDVSTVFKSLEEHVKHIKEVLGLLRAVVMTLKLKKYHFFSESIDYLGHVIAPGKLQAAKMTTQAIESLRYVEDISEMRSFLGLCNVYRRFVPCFAKNAAFLNKKLKNEKTSQFVLDYQERRAVNELKNYLVSPPVLALPRAKSNIPWTSASWIPKSDVCCCKRTRKKY